MERVRFKNNYICRYISSLIIKSVFGMERAKKGLAIFLQVRGVRIKHPHLENTGNRVTQSGNLRVRLQMATGS
jgi:hypothetical protein